MGTAGNATRICFVHRLHIAELVWKSDLPAISCQLRLTDYMHITQNQLPKLNPLSSDGTVIHNGNLLVTLSFSLNFVDSFVHNPEYMVSPEHYTDNMLSHFTEGYILSSKTKTSHLFMKCKETNFIYRCTLYYTSELSWPPRWSRGQNVCPARGRSLVR